MGLSPEGAGQGYGAFFLTSVLEFIENRYKTLNIRLVVAEWNERAIKVYHRVG